MFKNILKFTILLFSTTFSIWSMEYSSNWERAKSKGPLKELRFEEAESPDDTGRHFGWLYSEEFNDYVYAAITPHETGYYVDYVDPKYKISLKNGFYFWKSLNLVKNNPKSRFDYEVKEVKWGTAPHLVSSLKYDETARVDSPNNKLYLKADKLIEKIERNDRYKDLPSFEKAFEDCCSKVYLFEKISPIDLAEDAETLLKVSYMYMDFDELTKQKILKLIPDSVYKILKSWLDDKLEYVGLSEQFSEDKNTREYVMNKDRVIDQFIIESIVRFIIRIKFVKDERYKEKYIDVYQILEDIEYLSPCDSVKRKELEEYLISRFESWDSRRILGMTAIGIINCNPGILQWD